MSDMKDWPYPLKHNACVCDLAVAIYRARAELYGGPTDLAEASPSVRQQFIETAASVLSAVRPISPFLRLAIDNAREEFPLPPKGAA